MAEAMFKVIATPEPKGTAVLLEVKVQVEKK
jgi:hypothetical protein